MILRRVQYELFESDAEALDCHPDSQFHEIDREIRLEFAEPGKATFVSWNQAEIMFEIATGDKSFFSTPPAIVRDMSSNAIWRDLVGKPVSMAHVGKHRQVLQISDGHSSVYCCSREGDNWEMDVVHITRQKPDLDKL